METMDSDLVFGPIASLIRDTSVEEIWINSPERIFVAREGKSHLTNLVLTSEAVRDLIERTLLWSGRRLDISQPFVDARLPDGSRLHVVIPEITAEHWAVNIRKHLLQAGKTTLLNALTSEIPLSQRVITIEEVFELHPNVPDLVQMQTRGPNMQGEGEIPLRKLIKEALRMRPSRIIVGEVREAEALDLLIALNSGLPGMGTIHANSARDAITKLQTLPLLAGENISHKFIAPTVASAIDLVIQVSLATDGTRRIVEIARVTGRYENDRAEIENIWRWNGEKYEKGLGTLR
jgi:pilus assembly protein CpaF